MACEIAGVKHYSSTTNLGSSVDMKPYISYTMQFIINELELQSLCLRTSFLPQDHVGEIIADMLESTMEEWI